MYNIAVQRLAEDPEAQGVIRAQDDSWQLVIDKEGFPHLWVRARLVDSTETGMVAIETFLHPDFGGIKDIMLSEFGGEVAEEDMPAAEAEWEADRKRLSLPNPK